MEVAFRTQDVSQSSPFLSGKLKADLSFGSILGHLILWLILSVITAGIGLFFLPYSFGSFVLNRVEIVNPSNGNLIGRLECKLDLASQIGHIVVWILISIITLGLGYFFYLYKTWSLVIGHTRVVAP